jgi:hypothetical protein
MNQFMLSLQLTLANNNAKYAFLTTSRLLISIFALISKDILFKNKTISNDGGEIRKRIKINCIAEMRGNADFWSLEIQPLGLLDYLFDRTKRSPTQGTWIRWIYRLCFLVAKFDCLHLFYRNKEFTFPACTSKAYNFCPIPIRVW